MELTRISKVIKEQNENRGQCLELLTVKSNRRALLIAFGLRGVQQLTGTTVIIFYCKKIFVQSSSFLSPAVGTIIYFTVQLTLSFVASIIVDFSRRRPLLIISIIGTGLTLFLNGSYLYAKDGLKVYTSSYNFVPLLALIGFVVTFSIGLQTIPLLMMGEVFPTNVKVFALCSADIYYSVIVTIISKFFHWSERSYRMYVPFFVFGGCCVLGLVFILMFVPETKGKTLEVIQKHLKREKL
ncbi:facilitated trehalose transporter Tret1-like [Anthonomus grandis grandis]|uniref:facilitated trehalose transporter Tret1-like n=1 Tax=Anthonomus grandis grandis TaxID=2921223 RepID=UPI0021667367|nr:facilitated trehalose transporter Tret1-like [Anthonomus grandis grandis]